GRSSAYLAGCAARVLWLVLRTSWVSWLLPREDHPCLVAGPDIGQRLVQGASVGGRRFRLVENPYRGPDPCRSEPMHEVRGISGGLPCSGDIVGDQHVPAGHVACRSEVPEQGSACL